MPDGRRVTLWLQSFNCGLNLCLTKCQISDISSNQRRADHLTRLSRLNFKLYIYTCLRFKSPLIGGYGFSFIFILFIVVTSIFKLDLRPSTTSCVQYCGHKVGPILKLNCAGISDIRNICFPKLVALR